MQLSRKTHADWGHGTGSCNHFVLCEVDFAGCDSAQLLNGTEGRTIKDCLLSSSGSYSPTVSVTVSLSLGFTFREQLLKVI